MGPMGLGPKNQNFTKIIKSHEKLSLLQNETDARRNSAKGALNDSSRSLIWSFLEQIVFWEIDEKVSKVSQFVQFWVRRPWTKPLGYGG